MKKVAKKNVSRFFISKRVTTTCLFISFFISTWIQASPLGPRPNFSHLLQDDDVTVGSVLAIQEDKYGFIWIGGKGGLVRYDGYRFFQYVNTPDDPHSLTESIIRDIHEDRHGELWFATEGGGLLRLNRDMNNFHVYSHDKQDKSSIGHQRIHDIFEDKEGRLWVSGDHGSINLYNRETDSFQRILEGSGIQQYAIVDMEQISDNEYLFGTEGGGIFRWHRENNEYTHLLPEKNNSQSLPDGLARTIYKDTQNRVWVGTEQGLSLYNTQNNQFHSIQLPSIYEDMHTSIWDITEDETGLLWLSSDGSGMVHYNPESGEVGSYMLNLKNETSLGCNVVRTIHQDKNNDFWIGCFPGGVDHFDQSNTTFQSYLNFVIDGKTESGIWAFSETPEGNVWLGTAHDGLYFYDRQENTIDNTHNDIYLPDLKLPNAVLALFEDSHRNLWLGSWAEGLMKINLDTFETTRYHGDKKNNNGFAGKSVWRITEDHLGNIWVATMHNGLFRYDYQTDRFKNYRSDFNKSRSLNGNIIWSVYFSRNRELWAATHSGAAKYNYDTDDFTQYIFDKDTPGSISHNWVQEFFEDRKGNLWVTTQGGGLNLYHPVSDNFTSIRKIDGLASDVISGITEDEDGYLWLSSDKGLTRFHPETKDIQHFTTKNGLQGNLFYRGAYITLKNKEVIFGGENGFTIFNPLSLEKNQYAPKTYITELRIFNDTAFPSTKDSPLEKDILVSEKVTLTHLQPAFSLSFTSPNYRVYNDNQYRYYLQGFDKTWLTPTKKNSVSYTNLDPGTYTFKVQSANNSGIWSKEIAELKIVVLPPWWKTWWAYTLYTFLLLALVYLFIRIQQDKVAQEKQINVRLRELDNLKDEILANTSHELRTPLNGIIGLAEILINGDCGHQTPEGKKNLTMIISSGKRLNSLINDILDFSKINKAKLILNYQNINLYDLLDRIVEQMNPIIDKQYLEIINNVQDDIPEIYADENRTQQILINLIGNAVKYTKEGTITIQASSLEKHVKVDIIDTGIGIAEEYQKRIFGSFEQAATSGIHTKSGTGLGLAITEKLVHLQHGEISVKSELHKGSTFSVTFIKSATKDSISENLNKDLESEDDSKQAICETYSYYNTIKNIAHDKSVLLLEHSTYETRQVVSPLVNAGFTVHTIKTYDEALPLIDKLNNFSLICIFVSEVESEGAQFCKKIRERYSKSELPVSVITTNMAPENLNPYYKMGANDLIHYPIKYEEFILRILKLVEVHRLIGHINEGIKTINYLPYTPAKKPEKAIPFYKHAPNERTRGNALIVDDEEVNRVVIKHQLLKHNMNVYEANSGERALEALFSGINIDIIFLDLMMPGLSGYEVCQEIRKHFNMVELPIMFITAKSQVSDFAQALDAGGNDILPKPISQAELYARTDNCLNTIAEIKNQPDILPQKIMK